MPVDPKMVGEKESGRTKGEALGRGPTYVTAI